MLGVLAIITQDHNLHTHMVIVNACTRGITSRSLGVMSDANRSLTLARILSTIVLAFPRRMRVSCNTILTLNVLHKGNSQSVLSKDRCRKGKIMLHERRPPRKNII